jgi:hypothetical protein
VVPGVAFEKPDADDSTFDDWLADFRSSLHVLQPSTKFEEYLQPEPVPECYLPSQQLARQLLEAKSNGIVYPSVRRKGSTCLVCFRPTLVYNLRLGARVGIAFSATKRGYETTVAYGLNRQV